MRKGRFSGSLPENLVRHGVRNLAWIADFHLSALTSLAAATGLAVSCFFFQSPMAARIASSANTEQWILTGGSESSFTMSIFLIARASSTVLPLTHSVASEDEAMAEPQPKVLNLASSMTLVSRIDLDLQLHDVAALGRADQAGADVGAPLVHGADVAGIVVVIDDFVAV